MPEFAEMQKWDRYRDELNDRVFVVAVSAVIAMVAIPIFASTSGGKEIDWTNMGVTLVGGLAIFLFGMEQMADGLKAVAGERMKSVLAKLTTNRFMGAVTGAFVTAVIQSSSVTTVLVVGFISAGLMSMAQSVGVIMGANIGTTITAQIIAFKITEAALLLVAVGFGMLFFAKRDMIKRYGTVIMGLGLVFFGMLVMGDAMKPLRTYQPFLDLMLSIENPLIGILIAAAFTGLIQSSSATTALVIVMASQGFITLNAGIALALGANIGTCVTALLASIGKPREAIRAAIVHILFNLIGVLLWVGFIGQLAALVTSLSPVATGLTGVEKLAAESPRQIANAHTIFNVANTLVFIWFTTPFVRLVEWLVPDKPLEEDRVIKPKYLDAELLETPSLALERVRLELGHMGGLVKNMVANIMPAILVADRDSLDEIARRDDEVDILHGHIIVYLGEISRKPLTELQTKDFLRFVDAAKDVENIGDIIETDLVVLGEKRLDQGVIVSEETREILIRLHSKVSRAVDAAIESIVHNDEKTAREVIAAKAEINLFAEKADVHQMKRLIAHEPGRLPAYAIEVDVIEKLKRIYYFAECIAETVVSQQKSRNS